VGGEAVQDCGPDLKRGDLAFEVAGHDTLSRGREAASLLRPDVLDDGRSSASGRPGRGDGNCARHRCARAPARVFLPGLAVPARRTDSGGPARRDGAVAGPGIIGPICGDDAEGLVVRDLIQQVGPHGRIADPTAGDLDGPDFQSIRSDPEVNLAPVPWPGRPMFYGQPLTIPSSPSVFSPALWMSRCRAPVPGRQGMWTVRVLW